MNNCCSNWKDEKYIPEHYKQFCPQCGHKLKPKEYCECEEPDRKDTCDTLKGLPEKMPTMLKTGNVHIDKDREKINEILDYLKEN